MIFIFFGVFRRNFIKRDFLKLLKLWKSDKMLILLYKITNKNRVKMEITCYKLTKFWKKCLKTGVLKSKKPHGCAEK